MPSDKNLIENMITDELVVQEAIRRGVTVSDQEIDEMVAYQREMFETLNPANENEEWVKEVMTNRIRMTGLTDDEFWSSDFICDAYKKSIYCGNLMLHMLDNNETERVVFLFCVYTNKS